jgi:hypothetical protein
MDRHDRASEHEARADGAGQCAHRQGARRSRAESALQRPRRHALAGLAGRDQGFPRQRGSAAAAGHEGRWHQAGVKGDNAGLARLEVKCNHCKARASPVLAALLCLVPNFPQRRCVNA